MMEAIHVMTWRPCPSGGVHEWTEDGETAVCRRCGELTRWHLEELCDEPGQHRAAYWTEG